MDTRVVVAVLLVVGGGAVAVVGAMPEAYLTPSQLAMAPVTRDHVGVKATIAAFSDTGAGPFAITDGTTTIPVSWDKPYPERFATGRTIVVHGTASLDDAGSVVLLAHSIEVGCPSKYGAA